MTARSLYDGERALSACDESLRARDRAAATSHAREAAAWYVPGAPHVPAAYGRLVHIARTAEAEGDRETALLAWRAVRTAAIDSAWLVQPHDTELAAANRAIARLSTTDPSNTAPPGEERERQERRLDALLQRRERARGPYVALLLAALATVAISAGVALRRQEQRKGFFPALLGIGAGLVAYAFAVWLS